MISITQLKVQIVGYPEFPQFATALEQRIKIGTGFHNKWYHSQREHMLGWMVIQETEARESGLEPATVVAKGMWGRLKCSPLMFWLAEASGVPKALLSEAETAAIAATGINPRDGDPHGRLMRQVLPWDVVAEAINAGSEPYPAQRLIPFAPADRHVDATNCFDCGLGRVWD